MKPEQAYAFLREHSLETAHLGSALALLYWDQRTMIPREAHPHRAEQTARLTSLVHRRRTDPARGEALAALDGAALVRDPLAVEAVNVREWRRAFDRDTRIPERLAVELARTCAEAETAWESARPANDWEGFRPHLERVLALRREQAECLGYEVEPYDALLEEYEPGERAADIEPVFAALRERIVALLDRLRGSSAWRAPLPGATHAGSEGSPIARRFPVPAQRAFSRRVIEYLGFSFASGRLDESAHPFSTSIGPRDARITTRYDERHFNAAFFGSVHETGHSLYELGLAPEHWGTPVGEAVSLGIHESQSRLWENMVARSRGFWSFFHADAQLAFEALRDVDLDEMHFAVNEVQPSLIRVEADEVTYNLHIMLRFELELALLRGDLTVADLPGAWNERMRAYLDVEPATHADGVLQDVHWSAGLVGYFPTYALGNVYAAQLFAAAARDLAPGEPDGLEGLFARGEFQALLDWLRDKVHRHGMRHLPRDLVREATGTERSADFLADYLDAKFGALYGA